MRHHTPYLQVAKMDLEKQVDWQAIPIAALIRFQDALAKHQATLLAQVNQGKLPVVRATALLQQRAHYLAAVYRFPKRADQVA